MNYPELIKRFWEYNAKEPLGAVTVAFYLFLLEIGQESNKSDFSLSDTEICNRLKITRPTIGTLRQKLCHLNMIRFQSQNGLPGHYKINAEYPSDIFSFEKPKKPLSQKKTNSDKAKPEKATIQKQELPSNNQVRVTIPVARNIPSLNEFTEYAKTLENYTPELNELVQIKYDSWLKNGWKNGYGKQITNWKSSLKNILPFLRVELESQNTVPQKEVNLQSIKRPKSNIEG